ncbi:MAG TPA: nitronate monooxygenase [Burkholderiales bacterium]|nr:nitronate monooxygenase [Burkholderiales bacterium]
MDGIKRRELLKATAMGSVAFSMGGTRGLFAASEARAHGESPQPGAWPNRRLLDPLGIEHPIVQAPMAGHTSPEMPVAVCEAGGLGSFPCALLTPAQVRDEVGKIRTQTRRPLNLNFFCHPTSRRDPVIEGAWRQKLAVYYDEVTIPSPEYPGSSLPPFGAEMCETVVGLRPEVVSFHFGVPEKTLIDRLKAAGCRIFSTATTVAEARWLEDHGADAVIAQGIEAGGHRGTFLATDPASQVGTFALVPQVVDAVKVPVIAAGGIADGRGIAAAMALGASAVQLGTAYLLCPEASISAHHRVALKSARDNHTVVTNVLTGLPARVFMNRIARELGPLATEVPAFPLPAIVLAPLRIQAESMGSTDFSALYAGQAAALARELPAGGLTLKLADEAMARLSSG